MGRIMPLALVAAVFGMLFRTVTPSQWAAFGEKAAMLVASSFASQASTPSQTTDEASEVAVLSVPAVYAGDAYGSVKMRIPEKDDGGGAVSERQLSGQSVEEHVSVKNASGVSVDFETLLSQTVTFAPSDGPQVLIVHTHATECYMSYYAGYYNADDVTRSTDNACNVTAVGAVLAQELRARGIGVIHDTTQHDHPQYTGAYTRSAETIGQYLQKYPSVRVVIDLHRDAMMQQDQTKLKPTVTVDGRKAAQMMVVVGVTSSDSAPNPHTNFNLRFGLQLHRALESAHEGIMRPLYMVDARYNQHLAQGSLLIEVGTDANVLSEATYSARLLGAQLAAMLKVEPS